MDRIRHPRPAAGTGRRTFLRLGAPALLLPLSAMAPASWRTGQSSLPDTVAPPPICRVATEVTAVAPGSVPRELKITWNTNAVYNVGVAVADERGFFAKRNLKVEKINFADATDQLLEPLASGKADSGVGMALAWMTHDNVRCRDQYQASTEHPSTPWIYGRSKFVATATLRAE
jgi:ABC-type nitrate/sulfonate/bicarbonate transport system substrate-binding protein